MNIALVHEDFDKEHLFEVIEQMKILGSPVIRAVWMECYGLWAALEGCHRIRAAKALGLVPVIDEVEYSDEIADGIGDGDYTVARIADESNRSEIIEFDDAE